MKFVNMNKDLDFLMNQLGSAGYPNPVCVIGEYGSGRSTTIKSLICQTNCKADFKPFANPSEDYPEDIHPQLLREATLPIHDCNCLSCQKVTLGKTPDIIEIDGMSSSMDVIREASETLSSKPAELDYRYLLVKNVDYMSNDGMDSFLKIMEEPYPWLKIFVTGSQLHNVQTPILSRTWQYHLGDLRGHRLPLLVNSINELRIFRNSLPLLTFQSVTELRMFARHNIEEFPNKVLRERSIYKGFEYISAFTERVVKEAESYPVPVVITCLLKYTQRWIMNLCIGDAEPDEIRYSALYETLFTAHKRFQRSLIETCADSRKSKNLSFYINLNQQLQAYYASLHSILTLANKI